MSADSGEVTMPKDKTLGYLPQNATLDSSKTIYNEMLTVFQPLLAMEKKLRSMEEQMADPGQFPNKNDYNNLLEDYDVLQTEFKKQGRLHVSSRHPQRPDRAEFRTIRR
ncbi:hypothetical protein QS257_03830 [Terrilactibacillus sp. S3-3]|nr:hypothetical protein QS257_03830 [Terrilactibacillus sp. S3-3]